MQNLKYIVAKVEGLEQIVIFSPTFVHSEMARKVGGPVLGAGFVHWEAQECYGQSISLGIESREEDTNLLKRRINPYA